MQQMLQKRKDVKMRKTFDVRKYKAWINDQLARVDHYALAAPGFKEGLCHAIEKILKDSDRYYGFHYLYWDEIGYKDWLAAGLPEGKSKKQYIYGLPESKYHGNEYARKYI